MKHVELGRTGERIGQLGLGCMLMGTTTDEETSVALLDRFTEAGGTLLDTANCYCWWDRPGSDGGESEAVLGRWMARGGRRDRVFLATKAAGLVVNADEARLEGGGADWSRARFDGAGARTLNTSIDDSLRRLGTDHVDLLYVHVDDRATPLEETLEALAGIVRSGKARYIGWSNVRTWRMERIRGLCERHGWPAPVALQQQHSYLRPRTGLDVASVVDHEQLDYLRAHEDLSLVAYSPILRGIYDDPAKRRDHWMMERYAGPDADARLDALAGLAAETGATPNQLVLSWLLHQTAPRVIPLIGPRTLEQYEASLPALELSLSAGQLARLDAAGA
ncbi:aldo/keto reductase [Streptomyces showdoensis]|uniref:Aldo/keto reductase n=1 Tax=Streptomyces showdoensis TaxID=68268 RepID=A0A2P2GP25_STREW|nr:aldo/keto reductase [Streptomyces showdoensis]KKZ73258.1 aldo/keto reductase [Streptomyces showdoensis]